MLGVGSAKDLAENGAMVWYQLGGAERNSRTLHMLLGGAGRWQNETKNGRFVDVHGVGVVEIEELSEI